MASYPYREGVAFFLVSCAALLHCARLLGSDFARPLWWRSFSSFLRRSSSFLSASCCNIVTCSLNLSISLSLLEWEGPTILMADLSSYRCGSGCLWVFLWTSDCKRQSTWIDSSEMLGRDRWASPLRDRFAIFKKKINFWAYYLVENSHKWRQLKRPKNDPN